MGRTLEDLKNPDVTSDEELLRMYEESQGQTDKFNELFEVDFSYSSLRNELFSRGYKFGFYKPANTEPKSTAKDIDIVLGTDEERISLKVEKGVADKWNEFTKGSTQKSILATAALKHFMSDYKARNISLRVKI